MTDSNQTKTEQSPHEQDWTNMAAQFWGPLMPMWAALFNIPDIGSNQRSAGRLDETMRSSAALWKTLFSSASSPDAMRNFMDTFQTAPDIAFGFGQTCLRTFGQFQEQVQKWIASKINGQNGEPLDAQDFDTTFIRQWAETYETELNRVFKIPQIGLTRFYQERALQAMDAFHALQAHMAEFTHMLYLPMEKSFNQLKEKMVEMAEAGNVDENLKTYYNLWIKLLEGQYMTLFQQEEYADALGRTLAAVNSFSAARQALIDDMLKQASIPSQKELDALYKEIHQLKKRMRALEKKR